MPHDVELIILLAVGFGLALVFGYIAARLRLPPLIGYLVAGYSSGQPAGRIRCHVPDVRGRDAFLAK